MKFKNKVVVITGATSGIGEACAMAFGKEGAQVVITGRSQLKLDNSLIKLQKEGVDAIGIVADAAIEEDNRKMAENEKQSIAEFLSNFPFESLDSLYINPLVNDGDQKKIIILFV